MNLIPALPLKVSKLIHDAPFSGNVTGNVTGDVTGNVTGDVIGNITNGGVNGYLFRSGVVSASSGVLIVPAGSSTGDTPKTIALNGNGTYCIVGNTQKCFYPNPCLIPVSISAPSSGYSYENNAYAKSYTAQGVLIDSVGNGGNLNIYGASYIILNGGMAREDLGAGVQSVTMSVANAYIDADTTVIPGMIAPPTTGVFTGDVVGNVTGNVTGKTSYVWTMTPIDGETNAIRVGAQSEREFYNVSPHGTITGTIRIKKDIDASLAIQLIGIDALWNQRLYIELTSEYVTYTIPPNVSGLYVRSQNASSFLVYFNKFTIT